MGEVVGVAREASVEQSSKNYTVQSRHEPLVTRWHAVQAAVCAALGGGTAEGKLVVPDSEQHYKL